MAGLNSKVFIIFLGLFCLSVSTRDKRDIPSLVFMVDSPTPTLQTYAPGRVTILVKNFVGSSIYLDCKSEKDVVVKQKLKAKEGMSFSFQANNAFLTARFWCDVKWGTWSKRFPAYGDGAPTTSNVVDIYPNGIFINNIKYTKW